MSKAPRETFRDYLRRVMAEENLTDRQIEEATKKYGTKVSRSWVNLVLTRNGVSNPGIRTLDSLAKAIHRSRDEVIRAALEDPAQDTPQLITSITTALEKLSGEDRDHYTRVLEDVIRSMRRAAR